MVLSLISTHFVNLHDTNGSGEDALSFSSCVASLVTTTFLTSVGCGLPNIKIPLWIVVFLIKVAFPTQIDAILKRTFHTKRIVFL